MSGPVSSSERDCLFLNETDAIQNYIMTVIKPAFQEGCVFNLDSFLETLHNLKLAQLKTVFVILSQKGMLPLFRLGT